MAGRIFNKLALRSSHSDPDKSILNISSNTTSTSPTLVQPSTSSTASHYAARNDSDEKGRVSFLRQRFGSTSAQKTEAPAGKKVLGPLGLRLLSASQEPLIEIVFVHGLRGGSVKTWQKGSDPSLFWPQEWLPNEAEFRNARIYSFGYEADFKSSEPSFLSVNDFGQALYEEIRSSPLLSRNPKNPIIFVAHSMGGLVTKKAHILAYRDRDQCDISDWIRAIFFLATPHRGSDYAVLLNNVLKVSGYAGISSSREYINNLAVGSKSTQLINEEFASCVGDLTIFSFYETLQTSIGVKSTLIVNKDSAVLGPGYPNERVSYLNANHGNMCKFPDPNDPNYLTVKNAIASVVQNILVDERAQSAKLTSTSLQSIRSFLGATDNINVHHERLEGSCQWIEEREDYVDWRDASLEPDESEKYTPSLYWVTANPGAGKTVLVTYVESQFEKLDIHSATYYFTFGKKESHSPAGLLRSLAYQMAQSNAAVRETLTKLHDEGLTLDLDNPRAIWSKIFRSGIFQVPILTPQYWLIDAVDECVAHAELFSLFTGSLVSFPLKLFITSRKLTDMPKLIRQLGNISLQIIELPIQDTIKDIKLYISSRIADLPVEGEEQVAELTDQIIAKSNTSFLWVRLVMDELQSVYSSESIMEVLQGIPEGMVSYYKRTVTDMAENKRERHIAKAMLQWVALAARPLSTLELAYALSIDVNTQLSSPKSAIEGLCGHLISIDEEFDQVRIVHNTAREFLASDDAGYFQISRAEAHERTALVCLEVLCGPEMQPPRHRRMLEQKRPQAEGSALLDYAVCHFSDHVVSASASSDELLAELAGFLSSTTLTWIDKVATKGDMHRLVSTARNLKAYLVRRSNHSSTVDQHIMCVDSWVTDLGRLAIKFHSALSTYPQSIYFLIPPLCPTDSAIHRQFRRMHDSLTLLGSIDRHWDDCVATVDFGDKSTATVSCGEDLIAVGFESGDIGFYNNRIQEVDLLIKNDLAVYLLHFDPHGSFIAGTSRRFLMLWGLQGSLLWQTRVRVRFFQLAFSSAYVLGVTQQGKVLRWNIETGELIEEHAFVYQSPNDDENDTNSGPPSKAPCAVSVSPDLELIALAYRNGPVCLFILEGSDFIGWALDAHKRCPHYLIFNPNPDANLLLVIYNESHLSLFDPWSGDLVHEYEPEKGMITLSATCSPSGQTFATVDVQGNLRIWDFESLAVLYHIVTPNPTFRMLGYTSDNFNLLDMTNHEMKVWSPPSALRKTIKEDTSTSDLPESLVVPEGQFKTLQSARVRAFTSHPRHPALFISKNNGDVSLYNLTDGKEMGVLYTHQDGVTHIASCRENVIASSDLYSIVQVWTLTVRRPTMIQAGELKFKFRSPPAIRQLLLDDTGEYLLVSTMHGDMVYRTSNGMMVGSMDWTGGKRTAWKWIAMPEHGQGAVFALVENHTLRYYAASSFPGTSPLPPIHLDYEIDEGLNEVSIDAFLHPSTRHLVLQYSAETMDTAQSSMVMFQLPPATDDTPASLLPLPISLLPPLSPRRLKYVLGFTSPPNSRLLFLSHDSWLCSISVQGNISQYTRHFFVPNEYTTPNDEIRPIQASGDAFVFSRFDKVAIIQNGLKSEKHVNIALA